MKKIMILGAGNHQLHLIEEAKKKGLYTVVISPDGDYPGLKIADKTYFYDVKDVDSIIKVAQEEKVSGVVSDQGDVFVKPVAYVAEKLGLAGIGYDTACLFTDKSAMRKKSKELGLPTIESTLVTSIEEAERFFKSLDRTAIIKPADSSGSRGVSKIETIEDLRSKFGETQSYSTKGEVVIEQFVYGKEFEVDSIVSNGDCRYMMYGDLTEFRLPDVFACTTILFPAKADPATVDKLLDLNKKTIEGFGLQNGLSHAEFIQDDDTGEIYLLEAAARGGGVYISSHIAEQQTGLNTANIIIRMALGEKDCVPDFDTEKCHCGYVSCYLPIGEVISTEGMDEVKALPYVTKVLSNVKTGMITKAYTDKRLRSLFFINADSRELLEKRIETIRNMVKIKVKTANGVEGPIWQ